MIKSNSIPVHMENKDLLPNITESGNTQISMLETHGDLLAEQFKNSSGKIKPRPSVIKEENEK